MMWDVVIALVIGFVLGNIWDRFMNYIESKFDMIIKIGTRPIDHTTLEDFKEKLGSPESGLKCHQKGTKNGQSS
jgi:hypothetical protein